MATPSRPNFILLVLDTLRYDKASPLRHLLGGMEDYGWAITPAPWTLPAHVSLLTGLYPSVHGSHETSTVKWRDISAIRNRSPTLMSRLKRLGYATYGYSANSFISEEFGFTGFDLLTNWDSNPVLPLTRLLTSMDEKAAALFQRFLETRMRDDFLALMLYLLKQDPRLMSRLLVESARVVYMTISGEFVRGKGTKQASRFLKNTRFGEPFFLFMNLLDVHEPYLRDDILFGKGHPVVPTAGISTSALAEWTIAYDSQANGLTKALSRQFAVLRERGLLENTVVLITSDHGQLLGEHDWAGHGVFLYDEVVKVPLLVKYPSRAEVRRSEPKGKISLTNVPRFILDLAQGRNSDSGLYSPRAFSESWGSYERVGGDGVAIEQKFHFAERRTCVFADLGKVTYNHSTGEVEEAVLEGDGERDAQRLAQDCVNFGRLNDRLRAALAPN